MNEMDFNTTCEIYRREINDLVSSGNEKALSEMIATWYARCGFGQCYDGSQLLDAGVSDRGVLWLKTNKGELHFCFENKRWKFLQKEREPTYALSRIAEVTQVPFAYLCGLRDAIAVIEQNEHKELSDRNRALAKADRELTGMLRRKRIAVDLVVLEPLADAPACEISASRYPDAPPAALTWTQIRKHYHSTPGVYFAWSEGRIVYVGATERGMHWRLASGHHAVTSKDMFSFIEMPFNEVYFAESCYVARYAPERNACVAQAMGVRQGGHRGKRREDQSASASS
jgi:hypothetical protein